MSNQQPLQESNAQKPIATLHLDSATTTTLISAGMSPVSTPDRIITKKRSPSPCSSLQEKLHSKRTILFPASTRITTPQLQRSSPTPHESVQKPAASLPPPLHRTASAPPSCYTFLATATRTLPTPVSDQETPYAKMNADSIFSVQLHGKTKMSNRQDELLSAGRSPVSTPDRIIVEKRSPSPASSLQEKLRSKQTFLFPTATTPQLQRSSPSPQVSAASLPPPLLHTASAPPSGFKSLASCDTAASATRTLPTPVSDQETPHTKKLRKVKEKMQEMNEWCSKVMSETEEVDEESTVTAVSINKADKPDNAAAVESVWVDELPGGRGLVIHFNCPCGKEFKVIRIGDDIYSMI